MCSGSEQERLPVVRLTSISGFKCSIIMPACALAVSHFPLGNKEEKVRWSRHEGAAAAASLASDSWLSRRHP